MRTGEKKLLKFAKEHYAGVKKVFFNEDLDLLVCTAELFNADECYGLFLKDNKRNSKNQLESYHVIIIDKGVKKEQFHQIFIHELMHFVCSRTGFTDDDNLSLEESLCYKLDEVFAKVVKSIKFM